MNLGRSFFNLPILWNRTFLAWCQLLIGIFCLIAALNSTIVYTIALDMFLAGINFAFWISDGFVQSLFRLVERQNKLIERQNKLIERFLKPRREKK